MHPRIDHGVILSGVHLTSVTFLEGTTPYCLVKPFLAIMHHMISLFDTFGVHQSSAHAESPRATAMVHARRLKASTALAPTRGCFARRGVLGKTENVTLLFCHFSDRPIVLTPNPLHYLIHAHLLLDGYVGTAATDRRQG